MAVSPEVQNEFEEAISKYIAAQDVDGDGGFLVDWMLVTAQHIPLPDGNSTTALAISVSQSQAIYRTAGLAQYAVAKTDQAMR